MVRYIKGRKRTLQRAKEILCDADTLRLSTNRYVLMGKYYYISSEVMDRVRNSLLKNTKTFCEGK